MALKKQDKGPKVPQVQDELSGEQKPKKAPKAAKEAKKPVEDKAELPEKPSEDADNLKLNPPDEPQGDADDNQSPQIPSKAGKLSPSTQLMQNIYTGSAESLFTESAYHPDSLIRPYNPDKLVRKDWTYRIYEDMLEDDQVSIAMEVKKDLILGSGFYFETKEEGQEEMQEDLEIAFEELGDRTFSDVLKDMLQAYEYGFSISEKIFATDREGKLFLKDCKPRHPSTWLLHTDPHGNITRYEQRGLTKSLDANPQSIIHYVNNPKHQNPYGKSDLYVAFQSWMTKRHITRFYAIFLEKAASPTPVGKYDRRADQAAIDDMYNAIKQFQTRTALVVPKEFEMEFLEAKSTGEAYVKGINLFNMLIGRALFMPDLLGYQGSETGGGSHALGEHQIGIFLRHIWRRREIIERIVNKHFVQPICMYNYGLTENFPKFKFNALSEDDAHKQADLWIKGVTTKTWQVTPEEVNHFRNIVKFPKSSIVDLLGGELPGVGPDGENLDPSDPNAEPQLDEEGNPIEVPDDGSGDPNKEGAGDPENPQPNPDKPIPRVGQKDSGKGAGGAKARPGQGPEKKGPAGAGGKAAETKSKDAPAKQAPEKGKEEVKKKFEFDLSSLKGSYAKKCDFTHMDDVMKAAVSKTMAESQPIIEDMFEDLFHQIQKKKIIQGQNLNRAETLSLRYKNKLQIALKKSFRNTWADGRVSARTEVKGTQNEAEFAAANIPHDEFLDFLDQETFSFIGDYEYQILKRVKAELVAAIKDGKSLSDVIGVLTDEGKKLSDTSLERFARTKTTEVFNKGRMAYFEDTGMVSAYQYSAILDDRTSDICEGLHGCIFEKEDAPVPPMHFNCRSILVPITKFEEYKESGEANNGTQIDAFIEENKGKGFPTG